MSFKFLCVWTWIEYEYVSIWIFQQFQHSHLYVGLGLGCLVSNDLDLYDADLAGIGWPRTQELVQVLAKTPYQHL